MKIYLLQARNHRSGDSSHRVSRFTIKARNLTELCEKMESWNQIEFDILGSEEMSVCDLGIHSYQIIFNKGKCTLCGKEYESNPE